jgi:hypothetical protein
VNNAVTTPVRNAPFRNRKTLSISENPELPKIDDGAINDLKNALNGVRNQVTAQYSTNIAALSPKKIAADVK